MFLGRSPSPYDGDNSDLQFNPIQVGLSSVYLELLVFLGHETLITLAKWLNNIEEFIKKIQLDVRRSESKPKRSVLAR